MTGGVMRMRELPAGLEVKAGDTVEFKPSGLHVMGVDLARGYVAGETVKGTLKFEKAGEVPIE
jgi:copper(I)-binding protein